MKKFGVILLSILLVFTAVGCTGKGKTDDEALLTGLHHVKIEVENYGTIELELDADTAPITVTNFINLAKDGFYDRLTFHRIISGFMIQGGDPKGTAWAAAVRQSQVNSPKTGLKMKFHTSAESFPWPVQKQWTAPPAKFLLSIRIRPI